MLPYQPFQAYPFSFEAISSNEALPTPISDIESETKSINGDLCESFEGLFSKQREQSTMSSAWSIVSKTNAAASQLEIYRQNQVGQNQKKENQESENDKDSRKCESLVKIYEKLKKKEQPVEIASKLQKTSDKIQLQKTNCLKQYHHENRNKLQKYRQLLSLHSGYSKLPQELLSLIEISFKLDRYLSDKKPAKYTENIYNLFKTLFSEEEMSTIWSNVKKIMFIATDHYCVRIDPLKNLCIGFAKKSDFKIDVRKQKLRKLMGEYYFNNKKSYHEDGIPQAYVEPIKTARFYPENLNLCPEIHTKLSKRYLGKLEEAALIKQTKLQIVESKCQFIAPANPLSNAFESLPNPEQLEEFCEAVTLIYLQKKVSHMYKSSLIEYIRKRTTLNLQRIFLIVKYISQEELFLQVIVKGGCKIFGLRTNERQDLINMLRQKRGKE